MTYRKVCKYCETPFTTVSSKAKYCSAACKQAAKRRRDQPPLLRLVRASQRYLEWREGKEVDLDDLREWHRLRDEITVARQTLGGE